MFLLSNRIGFSLIEALAAAFIGGVILVGTGKMLSVSIHSSQVVRSSVAEQSLMWAMGKVLTDTIQCKANLKPVSGGISETNGQGTLNSLIQGLDDPNVDDFTIVEIGNFKDSLEIVKMELTGNTGNPKTSTVNRDFIVYYKKKGVGTLEDKPCDSSDTDGCYFQACSLQYKLQNTSNPDVTVCDVQNCTGISGGNHVAGISCNPGTYLSGFDSNGNKICKILGECAPNQYLKGFDISGNKICKILGECAPNQYLKGFDISGNKICEILGECAPNQYLKGFDISGNKICEMSQKNQSCPSGQYLKGFNSSGNKVCSNLPVSVAGQSCSSGQYLRGFSSSGNRICNSLPPPPPPPPPPPICSGSQIWSASCNMCTGCGALTNCYELNSSCTCVSTGECGQ